MILLASDNCRFDLASQEKKVMAVCLRCDIASLIKRLIRKNAYQNQPPPNREDWALFSLAASLSA